MSIVKLGSTKSILILKKYFDIKVNYRISELFVV